MIRQITQISIIALSGFILAGCFSTTTAPIDPNAATCLKLKREMVYDSSNIGYEADKLTNAQRNRVKELYKQNNCM